MIEEWKDIEGYDGRYQVSNQGHIRSRNGILKAQINHKGYCVIRLSKGRLHKHSYSLHRLVASYFIDNPLNLPQVNHKDGNKTNNTVSNLEWCDNLYNQRHSWQKWRKFKTNGCDKCVRVLKDGHIVGEFNSITESLSYLNLPLSHKGNVTYVLQGKRHHCKGYVWQYC